jgi:type I restriction enzyme S subunit
MSAPREAWKTTTLGEIAKVTSGGTPSRKEPSYWNGNIPWVTTSLIDFNTITTAEEFITEQGIENSSAKVFPKGTILMAMFGQGVTRGKVAVLGIDAAFNQACVGITPSRDVNAGYLYQYLAHSYESIRKLSNSGSQENLNAALIKGIHVPLPALPEQEKIASIVFTWDRGIRQLTDLIAAKLRFKQGLMQQLLTGSKRITPGWDRGSHETRTDDSPDDSVVSLEIEFGITGKSFKEGIPAVSDCPVGWTQHSFRELFKVVERPAELRDDAEYQLVTAKRYRGGIVPREHLRGEQIKTKTQFFVAGGDFLISKRQIIHGACGMVPTSLDGAVVSNEYACLQPSSQLDPGFLNYLTHTRYFQQTCFHASVGVALEKMIFRLDQWLKHLVNLPPLAEQRTIAHGLSTMDREILLLARQRRLLKEQKKGLMQKLLTGQVRVKLPEGGG